MCCKTLCHKPNVKRRKKYEEKIFKLFCFYKNSFGERKKKINRGKTKLC